MRRRPLVIEIGQSSVRWICRVVLMILFRVRVHGLKNYPATDGFLICSNHQSHLDPVVLGSICPRPINYLGRESLFRINSLSWFLRWNDTIPIDREGNGLAGLKETMRRLERRETVLIFPEGTRTTNGELQPVKLGFAAVGRRAKASLLPVGLAGTFQALPRASWRIRFVRIHVVIGAPLLFRDYGQLSGEELGKLLSTRLAECFAEARYRSGGG